MLSPPTNRVKTEKRRVIMLIATNIITAQLFRGNNEFFV